MFLKGDLEHAMKLMICVFIMKLMKCYNSRKFILYFMQIHETILA